MLFIWPREIGPHVCREAHWCHNSLSSPSYLTPFFTTPPSLSPPLSSMSDSSPSETGITQEVVTSDTLSARPPQAADAVEGNDSQLVSNAIAGSASVKEGGTREDIRYADALQFVVSGHRSRTGPSWRKSVTSFRKLSLHYKRQLSFLVSPLTTVLDFGRSTRDMRMNTMKSFMRNTAAEWTTPPFM